MLDMSTAVLLFRQNWRARHDRSPEWRARYRRFARMAVADLRYHTGRPRKMFGPSHYGHDRMRPCPACGRPHDSGRIPPPRVPLDTRCACCCQ